MKRNYIYVAVAIVVVIGVTIFWTNRNIKVDNVAETSTLISPSPSQSSIPSQYPKSTKSTPQPTPGLIAKEINQYQYWVDRLGPLNRHLVLDENCTSIVPSQVTYPNNTQIMLDNTLSPKSYVLKIGSNEYSLDANSWRLVTLSSPTLPAQLFMFCGSMELGRLDLVTE